MACAWRFWGTTLSLYYAENYPQRVVGLILRGIFLGRDEDIKWLYQGICNVLS